MPEMIRDGRGNGYLAGINSENRLQVGAVTYTGEHHENHHDQECYSVYFNVTPTGAADNFLYIQNTSDKDLCITSLRLYAASAEAVEVYLGTTGTPVGGTTNTPNTRYSASSTIADCTCEHGNDITGLTVGNRIDRIYLGAAGASLKTSWGSMLIIPDNTAMCLAAVTGAINIVGTLSINFHSHEW